MIDFNVKLKLYTSKTFIRNSMNNFYSFERLCDDYEYHTN